MKIGIIIGTTRDGRSSIKVGEWLFKFGNNRKDANYEIIDLKDYNLPFLGDKDINNSIEKWNKKLAEFDAFIFVTAEYNHSIPAVLKNSIDIAARDSWINKAAAVVSYGSLSGARAAEHLRGVLSEMSIAHVRTHPAFSIFIDFRDGVFTPRDIHLPVVNQMFDDLILWSKAMTSIRTS